MNFIPEQSKNSQRVPYYEDATKADGWQGQATEKTIMALQSEITQSLSRLGGLVTGFQRGTFQSEDGDREGFRIHYAIDAADGRQVPGRIDIAALPLDPNINWRMANKAKHKELSLKMALYMLRIALDGNWFLQQLSPGFAALVPFMLGPGKKTISELWAESAIMNNLLPPGDEEFLEGEAREV
ncbi:MAG: hypothetical protein A2029_01410 [Chloroflexi bacterium RBG_19FT_COMBO_47_9]|nr:MAG: hypothetical protein A2W25_05050 [candidate division Zixibacteria bacterium RBG_16_53_22]OGO66565.1 MAG: hypothetical protein A2029_01410 [Chloroflexi bacterium RBG_19FT_COMBO_47_9]